VAAPAPAPVKIGDELDGKYKIVREIGSGAMGVIYVARHLTLGRSVAIKVLRPELTQDPELAKRFEQEARAASAIGHPHIVDVFDLGRTPAGGRYMVMELLDGRSLAGVLQDEGALPARRAIDLVLQVLAALGAAHKSGIVHRDLKPENVFVVETEDRPSFVKLLDFGISKVLDRAQGAAAPRETQFGTILGTPAYMSPEQARGATDLVDHRTDLWAAGIVLYEALVGRAPFRGDNYNAVIIAIMEGQHERAASLVEGLSPAVDEVIEKALAPKREDRWESARAMREALIAAADAQLPVAAREVDSVVKPPAPRRPSTPLPVMDGSTPPPAPVLPIARPKTTPEVKAAMVALETPVLAPIEAGPPRSPIAPIDRRRPATPPPQTQAPDVSLELAEKPGEARFARQGRTTHPVIEKKRSRAPIAVVAALIVVGFAVAAFAIIRNRASKSAAKPKIAHVTIVTPNAHTLVDGKPWDQKPIAGAHTLEVSAGGYVTRRISVDGKDVSVRLAHTLVPIDPDDRAATDLELGAYGAAPGGLDADQIDAALRKLDGVRACFTAVVPKMAKPADAELADTFRGCAGAFKQPAMSDLDAATSSFGASLGQDGMMQKANGEVQLRLQLRRYRTIWEVQEAQGLARAGDTLAAKTRTFAIAAEAQLRSVTASADTAKQRADAADRAWQRVTAAADPIGALPGGPRFLDAARQLRDAHTEAAWNELVAAFNALVTD
jgi:serine/threonine-protein kinase